MIRLKQQNRTSGKNTVFPGEPIIKKHKSHQGLSAFAPFRAGANKGRKSLTLIENRSFSPAYKIIVSLLLCLALVNLWGQSKDDCLAGILAWEEQIYQKKYTSDEEAGSIAYRIITTDWEGQILHSKVRLYRSQTNLHFFSEQADVIQDSQEMYLVLHAQKTILRNNAPEEGVQQGFSDEFLAMREAFIKQSELISCGPAAGSADVRTVAIKAPEDPDGLILIDRMIYRYDTRNKKLLSTTIHYLDAYKVKTIEIQYDRLDLKTGYDFGKRAASRLFQPNGQLKEQYQNYRLIDNR